MDFVSPGTAGRPLRRSPLGFSGRPCCSLHICVPVEGFGAFRSRSWVGWKFLSPPASLVAVFGRQSLAGISPNQFFQREISCSVLCWCCCLRPATGKWFFVQFSVFSPSWVVLGSSGFLLFVVWTFFLRLCCIASSLCHVCLCEGGREVTGGDGGLFPFKVAEASRRKRSFIRLSLQEFRWVTVQMVRFCFSKGEPLWLKTFRWG